MIKKLIFDLDNTLIIPNYNDMESFINENLSGVDPNFSKDLNRLLFMYEEENTKYEKEKLYKYLNDRCNVEIPKQLYNDLLEGTANLPEQDFSNSIEILKYLKEKGFEIVILTIWFKDIQCEKINVAGLSKYIDKVYSGEEFLKPRMESFRNASRNYHYDECAMIGDNYEKDILIPKKLGMKTFYLNKNDKNIDKGVIKIENIIELKGYL